MHNSLRLRMRSYLLRHINGTDVQLVHIIYATHVINYIKVFVIKVAHIQHTSVKRTLVFFFCVIRNNDMHFLFKFIPIKRIFIGINLKIKCISLVLVTQIYHDARFIQCKSIAVSHTIVSITKVRSYTMIWDLHFPDFGLLCYFAYSCRWLPKLPTDLRPPTTARKLEAVVN